MKPTSTSENANTFAVLDLGSNSFHMLVAKLDDGNTLQLIDKLKDKVRLAGGLNKEKYLSDEIQQRAFKHFSQYADRLRGIPSQQVRVVATDTFRRAKNGAAFLEQSEAVLGFPIEIISGLEEARLIHKGVSHDFPSSERRLIIDIGGGSTELIVSDSDKALHLASLKMGCVSWSKDHFSSGWTAENFRTAIAAAHRQIGPHIQTYQGFGWTSVCGTSGTVKALEALAIELNHPHLNHLALTQIREVMQTENRDHPILQRISDSRRAVLAGGLSILTALFEAFTLESMQWLSAALREGVLLEMLGRIGGEDIRDKSVLTLSNRFQVDRFQHERIANTLQAFIPQVSESWNLSIRDIQYLRWAVLLHEIGRTIAFSGYHRHSAYIVKHADLPGFSRREQQLLSMLIFHHRGKIKHLNEQEWAVLPTENPFKMLALLRLSIRLHRKRKDYQMSWPLKARENTLHLNIPGNTLHSQPLLRADLEHERTQLSVLGLVLEF